MDRGLRKCLTTIQKRLTEERFRQPRFLYGGDQIIFNPCKNTAVMAMGATILARNRKTGK